MDKSKRFINYLDNYADIKDISFLGFSSLITSINNDFLNKDPRYLINQKYGKIKLDEKIVKQEENKDYIIKSKKVTITNEINTISDLIEIINTYEYQQDTDYNIDLKSLHNVKKELVLLNSMIGMHQIKESILEQMLYFIQKLDVDKNGDSDFKHTVIYGPPGTGKTEIAKLIGIMYSKLGILKNNVFKKVTRSDLIAGYLGQTAIKTSKIINECIGGVLFIDEAYSLASNENNDSFSKECLDTLCEKLSDHKNELMVIIAGYEDELKNTFFKVNKGLESRFIWKFQMDKYNSNELTNIFIKKVNDIGWLLEIDNQNRLLKWFEKQHTNFKNYGRDMEQLLTYIKICHGKRIYGKNNLLRKKITMDDINNAYDVFKKNRDKQEIPNNLMGIYV